mmetsp:Transcript_51872/g.155676  ORF Transcript_51872/g.155676 Transcript_51872/m.155676 type:complete len:186 (+) Transcript_51872:790-1347(+)
MLNHKPSVGTSGRVTDNGELQLTVDEPFLAGEEVFISYDQLANLDTLVNYGFVCEDNPFNVESIVVRMINQSPIPLAVEADGSISGATLAPLREVLATAEEFDRVRKDGEEDSSLLAFAVPVSDRNEEEVMAVIGAAVDDALYEAKGGAESAKDDLLVASYLKERARTMELGLSSIAKKFPELGY